MFGRRTDNSFIECVYIAYMQFKSYVDDLLFSDAATNGTPLLFVPIAVLIKVLGGVGVQPS